MTQKEYNKEIDRIKAGLWQSAIEKNLISMITTKYIASLEQRNAELEVHKTCEGCEHEANKPLQPPCNLCSRQGTDRYEPKGK